MKKLISLTLALLLILSAATVFSLSTAAADGFKEGDVLYFKVENPAEWTQGINGQGAIFYANFTSASRADNGGSVIIASADKTKYDPVTGVVYDSARGVYSYTVTAADAGKTAMRFWRGNSEKLWNETVVITAADFAAGKNTAVVTDWSDTGYLTSSFAFDLGAKLTLSAKKGEVGDSFDISVSYGSVPDSADIACEILINDKKVADSETYKFTPAENGLYQVTANLTAAHWQTGELLSKATLTDTITVGSSSITADAPSCLFAQADAGNKDTEAWVKWYGIDGTYYLFLPSSIKEGETLELYSSYTEETTLGSQTIPANTIFNFKPEANKEYVFRAGRTTRTVKFMYSSAEAALFVNNTEDFDGMDFFTYLQQNKANSVAATGAVTNPNGTLTNAEVKKMKGRGNTSWDADKKGFNVTFKEAISVAGMVKCKKFSLISNFQDAAMARNRILYDMADEIGIPYSSNSRIIDLYTNGKYQGTYQMCQKIDVGKNTLMPDIDDEDYLDTATGGVKSDFSFVTEIDSSPAEDDFHFTVQNGCNLTMKSPELEAADPNLAAVRGYVKSKFNAMWNKLTANAADLDDYIDLDSLAKTYLINELGKNWDSGATSFFLTYKPDASGKYKFYACPVWDYDNSLGNANGIASDLRRMNCDDYTLPSGWFSTLKSGYSGPNFLATAAKASVVMDKVYTVWFESFLPAIDKLTSTGVSTGKLYSADVYRSIIKGSAEMNYKIWPLETNAGWVADHSSVKQYRAAYTRNSYGQVTAVNLSQDSRATSYDQYTYDGQFDYMMDWTTSRAAWISAQYINNYKPGVPPTEPPTEAPTDAPTSEPTAAPTEPAPAITPYPAPKLSLTNAIAAWVFDDAGKTEGDKLTEYGSGDAGYAATKGKGTLSMTVDGTNMRALEWSAPEYGPTSNSMTPIMAAGKSNLWGTPYIQVAVSTKGYQDIKLTAYLAGSNKAPAKWKLQYSTDGTAFTDTGDQLTITTEKRKVLTAYIDAKALPAAAADQENLILRLVPVDMTTVSGGNTADKPSGGEIALNYIVVEGTRKATGERLLGDADMDGAVTILDATRIQRWLADLVPDTDIDKEAADISGTGITILDATRIQRYLADLPVDYPINKPIAKG